MSVPLPTPRVPGDPAAAGRTLDAVLAAQDGPALRDQLAAPVTGSPPTICTDEVCITCSDEGRVAEVVAPAVDATARVRTAAGEETVMTLLVDPVAPGDLLLVHAGTAIARLGEQ